MSIDEDFTIVAKRNKTPIVVAAICVVLLLVSFVIVRKILPPADFTGPATGSVKVKIQKGDSLAVIANTLKTGGVISSVDRLVNLCKSEPKCNKLQPGTYKLGTGIPVKLALSELLNPAYKIYDGLLIREGLRSSEVVTLLSEKTGIPATEFEKIIKHPQQLGLPSWADGHVEGFLFPATYDIPTDAKPLQILQQMVGTAVREFKSAKLIIRAKALELTPIQLLTIASITQAESHPRDFNKVARVILNRLSAPMRLQMDSTVAYGLNRKQVILSTADLAKDTPYNTYIHDGLPPGPINSPGIAAIEAISNPAQGNWLYFITVDLDTQETKFTDSYTQFMQYKDEFLSFCSSHPGSC